MESDVLVISLQYKTYDTGRTFAIKLENAVPNLFTFVNHPGMEPTNNDSERMLRKVVIFHKIRYGVDSARGARMFSNILTCILTWRRRGLNVQDMRLKMLCGT